MQGKSSASLSALWCDDESVHSDSEEEDACAFFHAWSMKEVGGCVCFFLSCIGMWGVFTGIKSVQKPIISSLRLLPMETKRLTFNACLY